MEECERVWGETQMGVLTISHLSDEGWLFDKVNFLLTVSADA